MNEPVAADLKEYLATLRRGAWIVALATVAVIAVGLGRVSLQPPVYSASSEVLVEPIRTSSPAVESGPLIIENEARIATSSRIVSAVRERLADNDLEPAPTTVEAPAGASTLVFVSESSSPRVAKLTADAYAVTYLDERRELVVGEIATIRAELELNISELTAQIEAKRRELLEADTTNEIDVLGVELDTLTSQLLSAQARLDAIPVPTSIRVGEVLHHAALPTTPSNRDFTKVGLLAAFLGLSLGVGIALLRERLARPSTSRPDLEAAAGAPLAAMVPPFGAAAHGDVPMVDDPRSPAADAFRVLAARVSFAMARQSVKTLLVTSPEPRNGKTTTAVNLAVALAESGRNTVLVLADLHKPAPPTLLNAKVQLLSQAVSGKTDAIAALRPTAIPNLKVLGNPKATKDAAGIAGSDGLRHAITALERAADIVVIDTTPILGPSDAMALASFVDAVLLVASTRGSTLSRIEECAIEIRSVDASILGVVLTGVTPRTFHPYMDRTSYYAADPADGNGRDSDRSIGSRIAHRVAGVERNDRIDP